MKKFKVIYRSRYHPLEGEYTMLVRAQSKTAVRQDWHGFIGTDEYRIVRVEEVK